MKKGQYTRIREIELKIKQLYYSLIREVSQSASRETFLDKPFDLKDYPRTNKILEKGIKNLYKETIQVLNQATTEEWLQAIKDNNHVIDKYLARKLISPERVLAYQDRNLKALEAFQKRKIKGLNLSDRVWKYTNQYKGELELGLDLGIKDCKSAAELSRDLRKYLVEPNKLFRRVRDERGELVLSKNARKYNPGQGVYRSSYKNAMRLTRTEINMAYRSADHEQRSKLDFVVGFEVKRSNRHFDCPVCESLKGKYPKDFKFVGWHPQCRCFTVPILATDDEFIEWVNKLGTDEETNLTSKNEVKDVPKGFKSWINENQDRIERAKNKPYFIKDNENYVKLSENFIDINKLSNSIETERLIIRKTFVADDNSRIMYEALAKVKDDEKWLYPNKETKGKVGDLTIDITGGKVYLNRIDVSKGKGYGVETLKAVINDMQKVGFKEFTGYIEANNIASQNMMKKLGAVLTKKTKDGGYWTIKVKTNKHYLKSVDEVKKELSEIGISLTVSGDESLADWLGTGLKGLSDKGFELPENVFVSAKSFDENSNDLAFYDSLTSSVVFNGRYSKEQIIDITKRAYDERYYSTDNECHVLYHEIGHWYHGVKNREIYEKLQNSNLSFNFADKYVSIRASKNAFEFVAEVFAGLVDGRKYNELVMEIYKTLGGIEI